MEKMMTDDVDKEILEAEDSPPAEEPLPSSQRFVGKKIDGKMHGVFEHYDEDENLIAHLNFEHGVLHGHSLHFDENQQLKQKMTYHAGTPHGPAEFYNAGTPVMHTHYHEGDQHGETTLFDEMVSSELKSSMNMGLNMERLNPLM
jgi:antitoxin component YwqK of YwqJK toxin-antitoxin module